MMRGRERWNGQNPSLSPYLHPSIKSLINIPMEMDVEDKGVEEKTSGMEGLSGHCYDVLYDESLFSVFESTGDSEIDARPADRCGAVVMEEDDAVSCSYGDLVSERSEEGCYEGGGDGGNAEEEEEEGDDAGGGGGGFGHYKSYVSPESKGGGVVDLMNEMERNKLFWEACLAS